MIPIEEMDVASTAPTYDAMTKIIDDYPTSDFNRKIIYQKLHGYTQQEIAKEFNISQSTVSRILSEFRDYLVDQMEE